MMEIHENITDVLNKAMFEKLEEENKRLREQLEEANKLILWCARISWTGNQEEDIMDKYLTKWGVK